MRLDHVALATRDASEPLGQLVGLLGGTITSGGEWIGFRPMQVFLGTSAGGMKVELLEPWDIERNDFLDRFLTRHGAGPHHLTFKVDDLPTTIDRVAAAGITPVSVDLTDPQWREAFLLPRDAFGTVVQLADSTHATGLPLDEYERARRDGVEAMPQWWEDPPPSSAPAARLRRVVLRVPEIDGARALYVDVLGGTEVSTDDFGLELEWPGGGRLAFEVVTGATPGVDRLELEGAPAALEIAGTRFVVGAGAG
jgi:methylmalonyl-CoA/ethylmalonyl-CoA epimerase